MVKVYSIQYKYPKLRMIAEITTPGDFALMQQIFRNAVKVHLNIHLVKIGLDENMKEYPIKNYSCNRKLVIDYIIDHGNTATVRVGELPHEIAVNV